MSARKYAYTKEKGDFVFHTQAEAETVEEEFRDILEEEGELETEKRSLLGMLPYSLSSGKRTVQSYKREENRIIPKTDGLEEYIQQAAEEVLTE